MTHQEMADRLLPMVRLYAYLQAQEGTMPLHWHAGECITAEEGHPALLLVFRTHEARDQLYKILHDEVITFFARIVPEPERVQ